MMRRRWIDFTDYGYPSGHSTPHWHEVQWNSQYPVGGYQINHRFDVNTPFNWKIDFEKYGGSK
jgi:hypothetical protein|nr:hypothetical protein [uncultured Acetatifactor sp.]